MFEKIILDMLTQDSVSVIKQKCVLVDGEEYHIDAPWRRAYVNSVQGRQQVQSEVPEPYLSAIMAIWGDDCTLTG